MTCSRNTSLLRIILTIMIVLEIGSVLILSGTPPVSKDALAHHLAVPKLYIRHGGMYEIPCMPFSYYPMNLDLLYLIPLYFGNEIIPKLIHFSFALLTAWILFRYLRRRLDLNYALWGSLFFLSTPIIFKLSVTAYVDLGLIFFSTASLLLLIKWQESLFQFKYLFLSAICSGLAMGTKYNGLIAFVILSLFVPVLYSQGRSGEGEGSGLFGPAVWYGLLFSIAALLVFSPWMIRNAVWTGNPIYPLYDGWFNPETASGGCPMGVFVERALFYNESLWDTLLIPLRIFFQGQDENPRYFDGELNPFLLLLPLWALWNIRAGQSRPRTEKSIIIFFAFLFFSFAFLSAGMRIRYISPIIPALIILSVFGVGDLSQRIVKSTSSWKKQLLTFLFWTALTAPLCMNGLYVLHQFREIRPLQYLSGAVSRDEYIERFRLEYPVMKYINTRLPSDARVLFIFLGGRGYYCDRDYLLDINRNRSTFEKIVEDSAGPDEIRKSLGSLGVTHLLIRYDVFDPWVQNLFTVQEKTVMKQFFDRHVDLLYHKHGYGVSLLK